MLGGRLSTGRLRHRVTLQNPVITTGDFGSDTVSYADAKTVWAEIKSKGSAERLIADQIVAVAKYEVKIRCVKGLTEQNRIKIGTDIFNIESINNPDFVSKQMILTVMQDRSERGDGSIS